MYRIVLSFNSPTEVASFMSHGSEHPTSEVIDMQGVDPNVYPKVVAIFYMNI